MPLNGKIITKRINIFYCIFGYKICKLFLNCIVVSISCNQNYKKEKLCFEQNGLAELQYNYSIIKIRNFHYSCFVSEHRFVR